MRDSADCHQAAYARLDSPAWLEDNVIEPVISAKMASSSQRVAYSLVSFSMGEW